MDEAGIRVVLTERLAALDDDLAELTAVPRDPSSAISFGKRVGEGTNEAVDRLTKVGAAEQLTAMRTDDRSWPDDEAHALSALPAGHAFTVPDVLFAKITDESREDWQTRFAGIRT